MEYILAEDIAELAHDVAFDHHPEISERGPIIEWVRMRKPKGGPTPLFQIKRITGIHAFLATSVPPKNWITEQQAPMRICVTIGHFEWEGMAPEQRKGLIDHILCFPAGTSVTGPKVDAASVRWYSGQLVEIRTASGNLLSGTPNHPILTGRGWVPLGLLEEGDYVLRCDRPERVAAGMDPHKHQVPAMIEDVAGSLLGAPSVVPGLVPQAAHDLDAYISDRQIDVVAPNSRLVANLESPRSQHLGEVHFGGGDVGSVALPSLGDRRQRLLASGGPAHGSVGLLKTPEDGLAIDGGPVTLRIASVPDRDTSRDELFFEDTGAGAELLTERIYRSAPGVSLDEVVAVDHGSWSGHVYNLRTSQGWYVANGIVTHNCHLRYDFEKETWRIEGPQFGEFPAVIERHGFWRPTKDFRRFASALAEQLELWPDPQPELTEGLEADEGEDVVAAAEAEESQQVLQESMT